MNNQEASTPGKRPRFESIGSEEEGEDAGFPTPQTPTPGRVRHLSLDRQEPVTPIQLNFSESLSENSARASVSDPSVWSPPATPQHRATPSTNSRLLQAPVAVTAASVPTLHAKVLNQIEEKLADVEVTLRAEVETMFAQFTQRLQAVLTDRKRAPAYPRR